MRFTPRSLSGQIALVLTAALLVASAINFGFLLAERRRSAIVESSGPAITRLADFAQQVTAGQHPNPRQFQDRGPGFSRMRFATASPILERDLERNRRLEQRLTRALEDAGVHPKTVHAASRLLDPERFREEMTRARERNAHQQPAEQQPGPPGPDMRPPDGGEPPRREGAPAPQIRRKDTNDIREITLAVQLQDGSWLTAETFSPGPPRGEVVQVGLSTLVIFVFVLAGALWVASRLSRPLADLSAAAQQVGSSGEPQQVAVRGPQDVRTTIDSFNAMSRRVTQLLNEKDVMLGALGHDLRTPLTSLRIRLESMEPAEDREKAIATIEETTALLQTILDLARQGRSSEPVQLADMASFVQQLAAEYAYAGAQVRVVSAVAADVACRPVLLRRLFRNLIDNAVAYGGSADISVELDGDHAVISIEDKGPGMDDASMAAARQPFVRGETSRNRGTGGAGLGLALADAIAKSHNGELLLSNLKPNGLRASVRLPAA
jgi:signal transduction histidine kinase